MIPDPKNTLPPGVEKLGLYRIWWKSGGYSLAAVGMGSDGRRWLAPTNWVGPSNNPDWSAVLKGDLIMTRGSDDDNVATDLPRHWEHHVRQARELLDTILECEDGETP
jgi:hypothetical protein